MIDRGWNAPENVEALSSERLNIGMFQSCVANVCSAGWGCIDMPYLFGSIMPLSSIHWHDCFTNQSSRVSFSCVGEQGFRHMTPIAKPQFIFDKWPWNIKLTHTMHHIRALKVIGIFSQRPRCHGDRVPSLWAKANYRCQKSSRSYGVQTAIQYQIIFWLTLFVCTCGHIGSANIFSIGLRTGKERGKKELTWCTANEWRCRQYGS